MSKRKGEIMVETKVKQIKMSMNEWSKIAIIDDLKRGQIQPGKGYRLKNGGFLLFVAEEVEITRDHEDKQ